MRKIINTQPLNGILRKGVNQCPNCGTPLLMFGCDNPRCVNYQGNKRFFYHEIIKTQAEIDKEFEVENNLKQEEMDYKYGIIYFVYDVSDNVFDRSYIGVAKDLNSLPEVKEDFEYSEEGLFALTEKGSAIFDQWHDDASCGCDLCYGRMKGICREIGGTDRNLWNYLTERDYLSKRITVQI